jgi:hypothetical protein
VNGGAARPSRDDGKRYARRESPTTGRAPATGNSSSNPGLAGRAHRNDATVTNGYASPSKPRSGIPGRMRVLAG